MSAVDLGPLSGFQTDAATPAAVDHWRLAVVRIDDDVYVLEDRCSHEDYPLSCGEVDARTREIECDRHGAMFDLATGDAVSLPATRPVRSFRADVRDGRVWVELPS